MKSHHLLIVWRDVDPSIRGPYRTEEERNQAALEHHAKHGDEDGLFPLDIEDNNPEVFVYSGAFFGEEC